MQEKLAAEFAIEPCRLEQVQMPPWLHALHVRTNLHQYYLRIPSRDPFRDNVCQGVQNLENMHRKCLKAELYPFLHLRVVCSPEKNREDDQATPVAQRGCGWETCRKGSLCRTTVYVITDYNKKVPLSFQDANRNRRQALSVCSMKGGKRLACHCPSGIASGAKEIWSPKTHLPACTDFLARQHMCAVP